MKLKNLLENVTYELVQGSLDTEVSNLAYDSRKIHPGMLFVAIAGTVSYILPWLLGFAAGAMIYVVVEELIPEAHTESHTDAGTMGVMIGFLIMMILDVTLG